MGNIETMAKLPKKASANTPKGLPKIPSAVDKPPPTTELESAYNEKTVIPGGPNLSAVSKARICQKCGKEGRVISNNHGVFVKCYPCNVFWPVSSSVLGGHDAVALPRGLKKETLVEPNWDKAYD